MRRIREVPITDDLRVTLERLAQLGPVDVSWPAEVYELENGRFEAVLGRTHSVPYTARSDTPGGALRAVVGMLMGGG